LPDDGAGFKSAWHAAFAVDEPTSAVQFDKEHGFEKIAGPRTASSAAVCPLQEEPSMIRKSTASWQGTGRDGKGSLSTQSGVLSHTNFGYRSRFEEGAGTNPEELLAASHAGCFTMAVAFGLQVAGFTHIELETEAAVSLEPDGDSFKIASSALTLRGQVPGIGNDRFQEIARSAEKNCPISKVLKAEVILTATLLEDEQQ
jgi:osmotically inducible protein OsmC